MMMMMLDISRTYTTDALHQFKMDEGPPECAGRQICAGAALESAPLPLP